MAPTIRYRIVLSMCIAVSEPPIVALLLKLELPFADDDHNGLLDGYENLLISHEPGSYTKLNQFS